MHTVCVLFSQKQVPSQSSLEHSLLCRAHPPIYTISLFLFSSYFHPSSQSPGGVCGQLVLPQWCVDFVGLPGWGQGPTMGPSHLARRASRPGFSSLEACSVGPGESLYAFITPSVWKAVRSLISEVPVPSGTLVGLKPSLLRCCKHTGAKKVMRGSLGIFFLEFEVSTYMMLVSQLRWTRRWC